MDINSDLTPDFLSRNCMEHSWPRDSVKMDDSTSIVGSSSEWLGSELLGPSYLFTRQELMTGGEGCLDGSDL